MISLKILEILKENDDVKNFFFNIDNVEFKITKLTTKDIERLNTKYPNFFYSRNKINKDNLNNINSEEEKPSIFCIVFVKNDPSNNNYIKLRKIKLYIDSMKEKIIEKLIN